MTPESVSGMPASQQRVGSPTGLVNRWHILRKLDAFRSLVPRIPGALAVRAAGDGQRIWSPPALWSPFLLPPMPLITIPAMVPYGPSVVTRAEHRFTPATRNGAAAGGSSSSSTSYSSSIEDPLFNLVNFYTRLFLPPALLGDAEQQAV